MKDELLRLIMALYSGFFSSSESKRPVCKCSLLYTTRYHPIRYRKANSKCKVDKAEEEAINAAKAAAFLKEDEEA